MLRSLHLKVFLTNFHAPSLSHKLLDVCLRLIHQFHALDLGRNNVNIVLYAKEIFELILVHVHDVVKDEAAFFLGDADDFKPPVMDDD